MAGAATAPATLANSLTGTTTLRPPRSRIVRERVIESLLLAAALVAVATTLGIVYILLKECLS